METLYICLCMCVCLAVILISERSNASVKLGMKDVPLYSFRHLIHYSQTHQTNSYSEKSIPRHKRRNTVGSEIIVTVSVTAYSLVEYFRRFGGMYFHLHMLGLVFDHENKGSKFLRNVGNLPHYTAPLSRSAGIVLRKKPHVSMPSIIQYQPKMWRCKRTYLKYRRETRQEINH
jgi:hypothetical protein